VLSQDLREFIKSLNDQHVKYLVVGGYAVAYHGHPRYTKDLDVWVECSATNAKNLIAALKQFGFESLGLTTADFSEADVVIQLGYPPNCIDLLTSADGVEFESAYKVRVVAEFGDVSVAFIDLKYLKLNKKASGRLQDLADLEALAGKMED